MSHAILSPSSASRWLACTPSARLEERFPDSTSDFAKEGSLAHEFGETILLHLSKGLRTPAYSKRMGALEKSEHYTADLRVHAESYATFVWEKYQAARKRDKQAVLRIEEKIDITAYVPEGFGTGDAIVIAEGVLEIVDLKFGKGVRVSADHNKQMMLYALGALDMFNFIYDIHTVRMTIYQPRLDNVSEWEISTEDLELWGANELRPLAKKAFAGEGEYIAGTHCKFCKAKARCEALATYNMGLAKYDFQDAALLAPPDIADILSRADRFKSWIASVEEYALRAALDGENFPGFKLVEERSVRRYSDEGKIAEVLTSNGFGEDLIYDKKLKTITAMEKLVTKKTFNALCGDLLVKPEGKPTLVQDIDPRPVYNSAGNDFANININD